MILTITIPTYNRPDKVRNTLLRLIPQLTDGVFIRVLDNHSDVVVKDYVFSDIPTAVAGKIEIIRHRVNIGGDANFQRCFELCETPYIWMIGDDDKVEHDAVEVILQEIEKYKHLDLIGINFKSNCLNGERTKPINISSTKELSEKLDHFGNWLFISTSVYKTDVYLKYIRFQAWGAYALASQVLPPMMAISSNHTFILSEKYIVTNIPDRDINKGGWSQVHLALGISSILEAHVGFKNKEYINFAKKFSDLFVSPFHAFCEILRSINFRIELIDSYHIYLYKQLHHRNFKFLSNNKGRQWLMYYFFLAILTNKLLLRILLFLFPILRKRALSGKYGTFYLFERQNIREV